MKRQKRTRRNVMMAVEVTVMLTCVVGGSILFANSTYNSSRETAVTTTSTVGVVVEAETTTWEATSLLATTEAVEEETSPPATTEVVEEETSPPATTEVVEEETSPPATTEAVEEETPPPATTEAVEEETPPPATTEAVEEETPPPAAVDEIPAGISEADFILLCNCVGHEAGDNSVPVSEKAKVVEVIMNRVSNDYYPDTILGVITDPGQFSEAYSYAYCSTFTEKVTPMVKEAVWDYFMKPNNYSEGYLSFYGDGSVNYFS